jgi:hypothetical protein
MVVKVKKTTIFCTIYLSQYKLKVFFNNYERK